MAEIRKRKLLTVVCESMLEPDLAEEIVALGAVGYTITDARGLGTHGMRSGSWAKEGNIRLEILCDDAVAARVIEHLRQNYDRDYGLLVFSYDVELHSL
jgi:hypothetical protein